jgi:hypothetical protein
VISRLNRGYAVLSIQVTPHPAPDEIQHHNQRRWAERVTVWGAQHSKTIAWRVSAVSGSRPTYTGTSNALRDSHGATTFHNSPPRPRRPDRGGGHGIRPRVGGHAQLHDHGGHFVLLPHRRHRLRHRPGGRLGYEGRHVRVQPPRRHPHHRHHRNRPPALPVRRRLPRPHRPLPPRRPLLRPQPGRFTQPDPSGQETNTYLYAEGDPVNHADPNGLFGFASFIEGTGHLLIAAGSAFAAGLGLAACVPSAGAGCAAGVVAAGTSLVEAVNADEDLTKAVDE